MSTHNKKTQAAEFNKTAGLKIEDDFYVFTPKQFTEIEAKLRVGELKGPELAKIIENISNHRFQSKIPRVFSMLLVPAILLPLLSLDDNSPQNAPIYFGAGLLAVYIIYFTRLFVLLGVFNNCKRDENGINGNNNLFRVYSLNSIVNDWSNMAICFETIIFENEAITSISEFSAISGGFAQTMLLVLSIYSWITLIGIEAYVVRDQELEAMGLSGVLELVGCFGLVLIGSYELDPMNSTMQNLHNGGAALGVCTVLGYVYQQARFAVHFGDYVGFLWFPILLSIIAGSAFVVWQKAHVKAEEYAKEVREKLNKEKKEKQEKEKKESELKTKESKESKEKTDKSGNSGNNDGTYDEKKDGNENKLGGLDVHAAAAAGSSSVLSNVSVGDINKSGSDVIGKQMTGIRIKDQKIKDRVTAITMENIISEAIFLFSGALSMCLYIIDIKRCFDVYKENCY